MAATSWNLLMTSPGKRINTQAMYKAEHPNQNQLVYIYNNYSRWTTYSDPATRTMLNPRTPKSQCFSARVAESDVRGLIVFVQWG